MKALSILLFSLAPFLLLSQLYYPSTGYDWEIKSPEDVGLRADLSLIHI